MMAFNILSRGQYIEVFWLQNLCGDMQAIGQVLA
jgi:hypothetical protein